MGRPRHPGLPGGQAPDYVPPEGARAEKAIRGDKPFIMQADGRGWLYVPAGLVDGPFPTHYEAHESPFENPLYRQQANPVRQRFPRPDNPYNPSGSEVFPCVLTTYRLTEHHTAGGMTRTVPHLSELQPEMFCEVSRSWPRSAACRTAGGPPSSPPAPPSRPGCW